MVTCFDLLHSFPRGRPKEDNLDCDCYARLFLREWADRASIAELNGAQRDRSSKEAGSEPEAEPPNEL